MFEVAEFGTDFKSSYNFIDGDLELVSDKRNLVQSIINRLNTISDRYSLFYNSYGGFLHNFHGWKRLPDTLGFMKIEITNILSQDPRLTNFDVELEYDDEGAIDLSIDLFYDDDSDLSLSFVIGNDGIIVEDDEDE